MSTLSVTIHEEIDPFDKVVDCQTLANTKADDFPILFVAYSLNQCPEDAIIGRSIFDCYDYINVLNAGIDLAKRGYDKVELASISSGPSE